MSDDKANPTTVSRRTVLGAASATPVAGSALGAPCRDAVDDDSLIGRCVAWMEIENEHDRQASRWSYLETLAAQHPTYFNMSWAQRQTLPMTPEMEAIEVRLKALWKDRTRALNAVRKTTPTNLHEAASLLAVAARIYVYEDHSTEAFVKKAFAYLTKAKCPGCGLPYVPATLPRR